MKLIIFAFVGLFATILICYMFKICWLFPKSADDTKIITYDAISDKITIHNSIYYQGSQFTICKDIENRWEIRFKDDSRQIWDLKHVLKITMSHNRIMIETELDSFDIWGTREDFDFLVNFVRQNSGRIKVENLSKSP